MASIKRGKETFKGYNAPKRTPSHPTKSHAVLAKQGDQTKLIGLVNKVLAAHPQKRENRPRLKHDENPSKHDTRAILPKARCPQHTGQTKQNGKKENPQNPTLGRNLLGRSLQHG
jgi:hypothetical protein